MSSGASTGRRLRAILGAAAAVAALALLWQLRPAWPGIARSLVPTSSGLTELAGGLVWLTLTAGAVVLLAKALRDSSPPRAHEEHRLDRLLEAWPGNIHRHRAAARWPRLLDGPRAPASTAPRAGSAYVPGWARPRVALPMREEIATAAVAVAQPPVEAVEPDADTSPPRVLLLGPLVVPAGAGRRRRRTSTEELIAYLALHPDGATRDQILEALWPGEDARRSEKRFWQAASDARRLLDGAIVREHGRYQLDRASVSIDVDDLQQLLAEAEQADELAEQDRLERALALFRGEPLAGSDFAWAQGPARRLHATFVDLLERVGRTYLERGNPGEALTAAERGIGADELNEAFWRLALEAEGALGLRDAINQRYERLRRLLDERLGLQPDRSTRDLHRRLLSQTG